MSGIPLVDHADAPWKDPTSGRISPAGDAATCLACTLPDCIYCLTDPPIELRRLCPIWLRDSAEQRRVQTAYMRRKRARAREARVSG